MPIVHVLLWEGRSPEQKAKIAHRITNCLVEEAKVPTESVIVTFQDYCKSDWSEGGVMASEKIRFHAEIPSTP